MSLSKLELEKVKSLHQEEIKRNKILIGQINNMIFPMIPSEEEERDLEELENEIYELEKDIFHVELKLKSN